MTATLLLVLPILAPALARMGVDPIHFEPVPMISPTTTRPVAMPWADHVAIELCIELPSEQLPRLAIDDAAENIDRSPVKPRTIKRSPVSTFSTVGSSLDTSPLPSSYLQVSISQAPERANRDLFR